MKFKPSPLRSAKMNALYKKHLESGKPFIKGRMIKRPTKPNGEEIGVLRESPFGYDKIGGISHTLWEDKLLLDSLTLGELRKLLNSGYDHIIINADKKKSVDKPHIHFVKNK